MSAVDAPRPAVPLFRRRIYGAMKDAYLDNDVHLGQLSPKRQLSTLADTVLAVLRDHPKEFRS
ncbi:hypothetical protein OG232_04290 [Streptomyces sp. NBC_01411]|uniref:hypothetical protein n=1 Tax=Streptomyces sp. NBC_01411 TaxID=2903857 RepID=UPI003250B12F